MKWKMRLGILVVLMFVIASITPMVTTVVAPPPDPKTVWGVVNQNATGVRAYNADPAKNGDVSVYIQNRTDEGPDMDIMKYHVALGDFYQSPIEDTFTTWSPGDPCLVVVDVEDGDTGSGDRAGYVAYMYDVLDAFDPQQFSDTELRKIPVPQIGINGTSFINISWAPLDDPLGLIAGFTVYRSDDNITWNPAGGDEANPITDPFYNDTNVAAGTQYYYALKVVFAGTPFNHENMYYGEGSLIMESKVSLLDTDMLIIEFLGTGIEVTMETIGILESVGPVVAQGYNLTSGTPTGSVDCTWSVDDILLGEVNPTDGTQSTFTAYDLGGIVQVTAENTTLGLIDTFNVTIIDATVDYILLTYTNGTEITDLTTWNIGDPLDIEARGYNNSGPTYIGLVEVDWSVIGGGHFYGVDLADATTFHTGIDEEVVQITGENGTMGVIDTFTLDIQWGVPLSMDEIRIVDDGGNNITDDLNIGDTIEIYAAGFNMTTGDLLQFVEVVWDVTVGEGSVNITTGTMTYFTAGLLGESVTIEGDNTTLSLTGILILTVTTPTADYIVITDSPDGNELVSVTLGTKGSVVAYASGYNNTGDTYAGLVDVTWSKTDPSSLGTLNNASGTSTKFTGADNGEGTVTISADDGDGHTDDFTVDLFEFSLDEIKITDAPDGNEVDSVALNVGGTVTLYASGYNTTGGMFYVDLVSVDWTLVDALGTFSDASGTSTTLTAGNDGGSTQLKGENTGLVVSDTIALTINPPTVDTIEIRDAIDNGGDAVTAVTFILGNFTSLKVWCAGYNTTADYIGEVSASWSLDVTTIGSIYITSGTFTTFTASAVGTGVLTADVSGVTDTVDITVDPEVDITAPTIPEDLSASATGAAEKTLMLSWTANIDDTVHYNIYRSDSATGTFEKINTAPITDTTYTDTGLEYDTTYYYKITAVDEADNESPRSASVSGTTAAEPPDGDGDGDGDDEFPVMLLVIFLIIIIVLVLLFLMMKKKPAEAPPEEKAEEPPVEEEPEPEEEEPSEEEPAEEEETPPPEDEGEEAPTDEGDEEKPPEE
jgi:hypothetical protein